MANCISELVKFYKTNKLLVLFMAASLTFSGISGYSMYKNSKKTECIKAEQQIESKQPLPIGDYVDRVNQFLDNLIEQSKPEEPQPPSCEEGSLENKILYK